LTSRHDEYNKYLLRNYLNIWAHAQRRRKDKDRTLEKILESNWSKTEQPEREHSLKMYGVIPNFPNIEKRNATDFLVQEILHAGI
jgi:hypothetical protein